MLAGCQQTPPSVDRGPQLDADGQRRSVALDSPLLAYLRNRGHGGDGPAWYDGRNDVSPAAVAGDGSLQRSVTVTRDRQYQVNGHVRDYFTSTTYRSEYRQSTR